MSEIKDPDSGNAVDMVPVEDTANANAPPSAGIVTRLAELPRKAHIDIRALAGILERSVRSVERAVCREELPAPFKLLGKRTWMAGVIIDHLAARQQAALRLVERRDQRRASNG